MRKVSSGVIGLRYEEQDVRNKSEGDLCSLDSLGKVRRGEKSQDNMTSARSRREEELRTKIEWYYKLLPAVPDILGTTMNIDGGPLGPPTGGNVWEIEKFFKR
ncbi:hypothetical protein Tco_0630854 [Tanacetum coccineum]|uniref:Uncharacterized protein n=1 Tax=Tanacetum coccineum TaxID=301880 RepID=A0ABQ4XVS2_9ASTR